MQFLCLPFVSFVLTRRYVYVYVNIACKVDFNASPANNTKRIEDTEMTEQTMTIRQMCEEFEVTPRTLRFYEAKELLFPKREGQKRLYGKRDRARLKLILRGKRFGFSLEEIRQLLDLYNMDDSQETQLRETFVLAQKHLTDMQDQRAELDEAIAELKAQMDWGAARLAKLEHIPAIAS
jgi:DNA-binding transcriptional MerR regulator